MADPLSNPPIRSGRSLVILFVVMVLVACGMFARSWRASILDRYEFRQLQTALSTYWMKADGFHLDYETPLFGPPWSIPMEFPTYQACVAALSSRTGMPLEQTGRLVGVLFLFASLPALYGLLALAGLAPSRRLLALTVILTAPVYLFYARTFMIETAALCLSAWFLFLLYRATASADWRWTTAAVLVAVLAALTKVTTFVVFCVPAALMTIHVVRARVIKARPHSIPIANNIVAAVLPVILALLATYWWVRRGDAVKDSNPFTGFLTARELRHWNFGDFSLRFDGSFWLHAHDTIKGFVLTEGAFAVAILCAPFAGARRVGAALVALVGFFAGPLIFANLYHVHDYYYCANAVFLTGAVGILVAGAWDDPRLPKVARWLAVGLVLGLQLLAYDRGYGSHLHRPPPQPPGLAAILRQAVPPQGTVLIYGTDWDPLLAYYADRRAIMVPGERENETALLDQIVQRLPPDRPIGAIVMRGDKFRNRPDFIRERAARFGVSFRPYARSGEYDLYLPETVIAKLTGGTPAAALADVELLAIPVDDAFSAALKVQKLEGLDLSVASPAPFEARTQYGISVGDIDGHHVINAHAPSELRFHPPVGAMHILAEFGLARGSYTPDNAAATDGVTVEVFEAGADGVRHEFFRRTLQPVQSPADRGLQSLRIDSPQPFGGALIFRIGPGPANNPASDWAYWSRIDIR